MSQVPVSDGIEGSLHSENNAQLRMGYFSKSLEPAKNEKLVVGAGGEGRE